MDFDYIKNYVTDFNQVKANFMEVLKDCFVFDGKLNRTKFWTYAFGLSIASCILACIPVINVIAPIALGVMGIGPTMRRLIDAGRSKWLVFLAVPGLLASIIGLGATILASIPIIGAIVATLSGLAAILLGGLGTICGIVLIVFCCFASKDGAATPVATAEEAQASDNQAQ